MEDVINEMIQHNKDFVEKPHHNFGNMPVCPFAKKARLENKIKYVVMPFSLVGVLDELKNFTDDFQVIVFVDPDKNLSKESVDSFVRELTLNLPPELVMFVSGPNETFLFHDTETRREPYHNIQIMKLETLTKAYNLLKKSPKWHNGFPSDSGQLSLG